MILPVCVFVACCQNSDVTSLHPFLSVPLCRTRTTSCAERTSRGQLTSYISKIKLLSMCQFNHRLEQLDVSPRYVPSCFLFLLWLRCVPNFLQVCTNRHAAVPQLTLPSKWGKQGFPQWSVGCSVARRSSDLNRPPSARIAGRVFLLIYKYLIYA